MELGEASIRDRALKDNLVEDRAKHALNRLLYGTASAVEEETAANNRSRRAGANLGGGRSGRNLSPEEMLYECRLSVAGLTFDQ